MAYDFSDWFPPTALSASIASGDTTIQVDTLTSEFVDEVQAGGRFPLRIGRGTAAERVVVTAIADASDNKLTVERGVDGFSATSHNGGIRVAHALPAQQAQAAEAANVQIPEPWSPQDLGAAKGDGDLTLSDLTTQHPWRSNGVTQVPGFLLDYENLPAVIPGALQSNHVRSSKATRWDANGNLIEDGAGTLRLQRDPATGEVLGLLYEPKRTQELFSPQDITSSDWTLAAGTLTADATTIAGQPADRLTEDTTAGAQFEVSQDPQLSLNDGQPVALSVVVDPDRQYVFLECVIDHASDNENEFLRLWYDTDNGTVGTKDLSANGGSPTLISSSMEDLKNGEYRIKLVWSSGDADVVSRFKVGVAKTDGSRTYDGDGSSKIDIMHSQLEISDEVTTPILSGGAVRESDNLDYRFDFPDKTTGASFSVQQGPNSINTDFNPGLLMGTNSNGRDKNHGVFIYNAGVLGEQSAGWKVASRNTDDGNVNGETIDRFEARMHTSRPTFIVRQVAIHTDPHTDTQKSDLESNYLTTP
jgi:hypothetical protein